MARKRRWVQGLGLLAYGSSLGFLCLDLALGRWGLVPVRALLFLPVLWMIRHNARVLQAYRKLIHHFQRVQAQDENVRGHLEAAHVLIEQLGKM